MFRTSSCSFWLKALHAFSSTVQCSRLSFFKFLQALSSSYKPVRNILQLLHVSFFYNTHFEMYLVLKWMPCSNPEIVNFYNLGILEVEVNFQDKLDHRSNEREIKFYHTYTHKIFITSVLASRRTWVPLNSTVPSIVGFNQLPLRSNLLHKTSSYESLFHRFET